MLSPYGPLLETWLCLCYVLPGQASRGEEPRLSRVGVGSGGDLLGGRQGASGVWAPKRQIFPKVQAMTEQPGTQLGPTAFQCDYVWKCQNSWEDEQSALRGPSVEAAGLSTTCSHSIFHLPRGSKGEISAVFIAQGPARSFVVD